MQVSASDLQICYGDYIAVDDMYINIQKSKITTIIGPNGSGKSTVLKGLTRLLKPKRGSVYLDSHEISTFSPKELARRLGVLPQKHSAPPDYKVRELVGYGRMPHQKWFSQHSQEDEKIIDWALRVTNTWELQDKSIHECSGGEAQRVWLALVLTQQPEILFLDEPTTYLDIAHQMDTMNLIKRFNRESGIGVVMVLHDLSHAMQVSDWIVVMKDGKKYDEGPPEDVITCKMMREVYQVDCQIIEVAGREKPLLAFREL